MWNSAYWQKSYYQGHRTNLFDWLISIERAGNNIEPNLICRSQDTSIQNPIRLQYLWLEVQILTLELWRGSSLLMTTKSPPAVQIALGYVNSLRFFRVFCWCVVDQFFVRRVWSSSPPVWPIAQTITILLW